MERRVIAVMTAPLQARRLAGCLVIVGNEGGTNVGASLYRAAQSRGVEAVLIDARAAFEAPRPVARFNWWVRGRRPSRLRSFSDRVVETCRRLQPRWLVATGLAPLHEAALEDVNRLGTETINYLTDDPWNPAFRSTWFLEAIRSYARVFSVRTANLNDLRRAGCRDVTYLPFGVDPGLFFPEAPAAGEWERYQADVFFAGGADRDRIPYIEALRQGGLTVALYGDCWHRFRQTRGISRGHAAPAVLRRSITASATSLCLVRRANRDGHSMRSFEVPAAGGCMLTEDTPDHRELFGDEGKAVIYFTTPAEAVEKAKWLVGDPAKRRMLAEAAHRIVTAGRHTYADRLGSILAMDGDESTENRHRRPGTLSRV